MRALAAATAFSVLTGALWAQATRPAAPARRGAAEGNEANTLAAESFRNSAVSMVCAPPDTQGRAGRLVVLTRFADRLVGGDWRTNRLLADIYFAQGRPEQEAAALKTYLAAFPGDHVAHVRWITVRLAGLQNADERGKLLRSLVDNKDLSNPVRAEAAAMLARLRNGQGRTADALADANTAIELDPYGPSGLLVELDLAGESADVNPVDMHLRLLRADPRDSDNAWQLALRLGELGLHKRQDNGAVKFMEHSILVRRIGIQAAMPSELQIVDYGNALLDAGEYDKAIEIISPSLSRFSGGADLKALLYEAYRAAGRDAEAQKLLDEMAESYKKRADSGEASEAFSAEIAWFYVVSKPKPSLAKLYAARAVKEDPNNPVYQRILGAAELASGVTGPDEGEERLKKLLGKDVYASVFLAERYSILGKDEDCKDAILKAAPLPRSGPAFRRLKALADKRKVVIPPATGSKEAKALVDAFDPGYLDMFPKPGKFIQAALKPVRDAVACGEPIRLVATLKNIGKIDVPLGERGLLRPRMSLYVRVQDRGGRQVADVARLPMAVWPAPRYLRPGESIECTVRLDVGELTAVLAARPLEDLTVTVSGKLDPTDKGTSSLPTLKAPVAQIGRASLLGRFDFNNPEMWPKAYDLALGRTVADLRRGTLPVRVRAARQVGALLAMASDIRMSRAEPPPQLAGKINHLVMLSMVRAILKDRSPVVRQQMIASLANSELDPTALSLLAPAIGDADPMVRCRLVELLAATNSRGHETIVQYLSADKDELVRAMAKAFGVRR